MVEWSYAVLAVLDRFLPVMALGDAMFGFLRFGAKRKNRRQFALMAEQLGLEDGEGRYEGYLLRATGDSNTLELTRPKQRRGSQYDLDRNRYLGTLEAPMVAFSTGRRLFDWYFAKRFATPALAEQIRRGGEHVDTIVGFVRRWGLQLNLCRISTKGISLTFYRGTGRDPYAYMPVDYFRRILPDLVKVARAMEALDEAASWPATVDSET